MTPSALLATSLLASPAWAGGSLKDLDKKNGFRDVALTQRCDQIEGLKGNTSAVKAAVKAGLGSDDKEMPFLGMLQYIRPSDDLRVGRADLLGITYTCYGEQLMAVSLHAHGQHDAEPLRAALEEAFGSATKADPDAKHWEWVGKKVILTFDQDPLHHNISVVYASVPMLEAKAANDLAIEQSAVNDL